MVKLTVFLDNPSEQAWLLTLKEAGEKASLEKMLLRGIRDEEKNMHKLVDSDANKVTKVFSTLVGRG
jgi:hypothetical protein